MIDVKVGLNSIQDCQNSTRSVFSFLSARITQEGELTERFKEILAEILKDFKECEDLELIEFPTGKFEE